MNEMVFRVLSTVIELHSSGILEGVNQGLGRTQAPRSKCVAVVSGRYFAVVDCQKKF